MRNIRVSKITDINLLIGRIIIGLYFLLPGAIAKIFNYEFIFNYMLDHDVPMTNVALILTIITQFICSISIILGWHSKVSAFILEMDEAFITHYNNYMRHYLR